MEFKAPTGMKSRAGKHSHQGHRSRVRQHFLKYGLDGYYDHQALELLLFYGVKQKDVNQTAHVLTDHFGSLRGVLEAEGGKLMEFPYIKHRAAALMKLVPQLARRYEASRRDAGLVICEAAQAMEYLEPLFAGRETETVYGLFLDASLRLRSCLHLNAEGERFVDLPARRVAAMAVNEGAALVITAHSRLGAAHWPGPEEQAASGRLSAALAAMRVRLADHLVYSESCFVSLAEVGLLK